MPYILNKTNGTPIAVVQDASIDQTTSLTFLGRNYAGYGEIQNENFLKLLENFANTNPPSKINLEGQLWYDTASKSLNVYDNTNWKPLANIEVTHTDPSVLRGPVTGNLWYDTLNGQLNVWSGAEYILVGPQSGSRIKAQWRGDFEYDALAPGLPVYNAKAVIGADNEVIAIVSEETYDMPAYDLVTEFPEYKSRTETFTRIAKGITLAGADPVTGSSRKEVTGLTTSSYFWGTAAEALVAVTAQTANTANGITPTVNSENRSFRVPFFDTNNGIVYYDANSLSYNPSTNILTTIASSALYADIAERYEADAVYEPGTVLMHGGEKEVTIACYAATTAVAGIVSTNPAYMMNSDAGTNETHPYIALKGRVPCKICGSVKKGDLLVASGYKPGYAVKKQDHDSSDAVIGKALQDFVGLFGVIEVKV
jgi:hypothetical protein